jgi:phosphomethylpyrimidine synthase
MTQLEHARKGTITGQMKVAAEHEGIAAESLRDMIACGSAVLPANTMRENKRIFRAIGKTLKIKVNANIGTSPSNADLDNELVKADAVASLGAESLMDLSIAGNLDSIRETILYRSPLMIGTVPLYEVLTQSRGDLTKVTGDAMIGVIRKQARQGVDFMTVHCGITREQSAHAKKRLMGIVSRGGSFLSKWMEYHNRENPLFERYDDICDIAREYDVTLSLGDALRPGALADAGDDAQFGEVATLGTLVKRARDKGVQVMVEGPGHVPYHLIDQQIRRMDELCFGAPLYILGPLVTDRSPGYDHISGAIGGTLAAMSGAAFLCYLTPAEHLRLPDLSDVREGVIASRIAAHAADIARDIPGAREENRKFSEMRKNFDWEGMFTNAIDPVRPRHYRAESTHAGEKECSMCGEFCAMKPLKGSHV